MTLLDAHEKCRTNGCVAGQRSLRGMLGAFTAFPSKFPVDSILRKLLDQPRKSISKSLPTQWKGGAVTGFGDILSSDNFGVESRRIDSQEGLRDTGREGDGHTATHPCELLNLVGTTAIREGARW